MSLAGRIAFVTGAASGIGKAIASRFTKEGARVVIGALGAEQAANAAKEIGGGAVGVQIDVTNEKMCHDAVAEIKTLWGGNDGVDILVANAGIQHIEPVHELSLESWRKVTSVHLDGSFLTTRAVLPDMYARGKERGGSIIYIGSVHSKTASVLKAPYVAAKHGVIGLCRTVAKEGGPHGIRANTICPGFVLTPLVEKQIPEQAQRLNISEEEVIKNVMLKDTINGEFTTLDDVADVAVMLAGHKTSALTGQSLIVSNGWFME